MDGETRLAEIARAQAAAIAKNFDEARGICTHVLEAEPENPNALALLGMVEASQGDITTGIGLVERAVALGGELPAWLANLTGLYRMDCRTDDALRTGIAAMQRDPDNPDVLLALALVLADLNRTEEAKALLVRAVGLKHDHADCHLALAQNLLVTGDYVSGLREYEWRNLSQAGLLAPLPGLTSAQWNGMHLPGGKLLVVADQGFGDCIMFARYLPLLAERCQEVIVGCSPELLSLLSRARGVGRAFTQWTEVPGHAAHCRLSSAPYLINTTFDKIPTAVPYLVPESQRVGEWGDRLDAMIPRRRRRVGLCWAGRTTFANDRRRSLALDALAPLAAATDVCFVPLQFNMTETDEAVCNAQFPAWAPVQHYLGDFGDTAALLANLDLVITVDTAIGHLAGAMAKRTWLLLSQACDWRHGNTGTTDPWYPTARLFRQPRPGAWEPVISEVAAELRNFR